MRCRSSLGSPISAALAVALALAATPAGAWTPTTHERIAEQAARLMPSSLRHVLSEHSGRMRAGAVATARGIAQAGETGSLDEAVLVQTQRVLDLLSTRAPLSVVAYEMGALSSLVALAEDPARASSEDALEAQWSGQFETFVDSKAPRFRLVFDGYLAEPLERDDVREFVRQAEERARRHYPVLASSYRTEAGGVAPRASFDERHPVFGVGSLAYSHAVGDTAKLWLYAWIRGGGDPTDLPYPRAVRPPAVRQGAGQ